MTDALYREIHRQNPWLPPEDKIDSLRIEVTRHFEAIPEDDTDIEAAMRLQPYHLALQFKVKLTVDELGGQVQ